MRFMTFSRQITIQGGTSKTSINTIKAGQNSMAVNKKITSTFKKLKRPEFGTFFIV